MKRTIKGYLDDADNVNDTIYYDDDQTMIVILIKVMKKKKS